MKKKILLTGIIVSCAAVLVFILYRVLSSSDILTFQVMFKQNPFKKGYTCQGKGSVVTSLDTDKLKALPNFPQGDAGDLFMNEVKRSVAAMGMDIDYQGSGKEKESYYDMKVTSGSIPDYEEKYYSDGNKTYTSLSSGGSGEKWQEGAQTGIESLLSSIDIEKFEQFKDSIGLTARDSSSSTFAFKVTGPMTGYIFGDNGKKVLEKLAGSQDYNGFVSSMNMTVQMKTEKRVNIFTPYARISSVTVSFTLPYSKLENLSDKLYGTNLSDEEKSIYQAVSIKTSLKLDFTYGNANIEKPNM